MSTTPEQRDPAAVIAEVCGAFMQPGRTYPGELPAELAPWYVYTIAACKAAFASEQRQLSRGTRSRRDA